MFYAAAHRYGIQFSNDYHVLYRFATKAERDKFVDDNNPDHDGDYRFEELTRDKARSKFPAAFRKVGDFHDESDMRDWLMRDGIEYWSIYNYDMH